MRVQSYCHSVPRKGVGGMRTQTLVHNHTEGLRAPDTAHKSDQPSRGGDEEPLSYVMR